MYLSFYQLKERPFQINTEPRFLWSGERHTEALSVLKYGVMSRNGVLVLTGNVGTGKTMLVNSLLAGLDENIVAANIVYTEVDRIGFINLVGQAFHMPGPYDRLEEFMVDFKSFLQRQFYSNRQVLLIVDEAHKLSLQILEQTRLLTNIEMGGEGLFSLFLVGQNELNKKLLAKESRALRQRITLNYQLAALTQTETRHYCNHRLRVAGGKTEIFDRGAMREIYRHSGGYPRRINVICERALLDGYAKGARMVSADIVKQCARDLLLPGEKELRLPPLLAGALESTRAAVSLHALASKPAEAYRRFQKKAQQLSAFKPSFRRQDLRTHFSGLTDSGLGNSILSAGAVILALVFSFWYQGTFSPAANTGVSEVAEQEAKQTAPQMAKIAAVETEVPPTESPEGQTPPLTGPGKYIPPEKQANHAESAGGPEPDLTAFFGSKELDSLSTIIWKDNLNAPLESPPKKTPPAVQRHTVELTAADRQGKSKFDALKSFTKRSGTAYSVQVGAFRSEKNAIKAVGKLTQKGYAATIVKFGDTRGRSWYTVRLGEYETRAIAQEKAADFSSREKMQSIVRPVDKL